MKINELDIFPYIEDYVDRDIDQVRYTRAQLKLKDWFKTDLTDEIFIELMKEIPTSKSGRLLDTEFYSRFQEFMSNYYIDSKTISKESFLLMINKFKETNNLSMNSEKIIKHNFFDDDIFGYMITNDAISSVSSIIWVDIFEEKLFSSKNLVEFLKKSINMNRREDYWSTIIIYQQNSKDILDFFINNIDLIEKFDIIIDLSISKYNLDFDIFMESFNKISNLSKSKQKRRNITDALSRQIRDNVNKITENSWYWKKAILNFIKTEDKDYWFVALIIVVLLEQDKDMVFVIKDLMDISIANTVLHIIIRDTMMDNISEINRVKIFELTEMEEFLPEKAKDIFIF